MLTYAVSLSSVGGPMTPAVAAAFRRSPLHWIEINPLPYTTFDENSQTCAALTRQLIQEQVIRVASFHLPFYGGGRSWDPSEPDEKRRLQVVKNFQKLFREYADLFGCEATLHASLEPPLSEHGVRLDQVCRTLEALIPLAQKIGFRFNVEFLPRTCVGNSATELEFIVSHFDPSDVGICLDVNHIMDHHEELPDLITRLAPRINAFHINDYDGVDELHWFPGQGIIDWCEVMKRIRAIDHDVIMISETKCLLSKNFLDHEVDPYWALKQTTDAIYLLENCDTLIPQRQKFIVPGN